jgi:hypothetical protein
MLRLVFKKEKKNDLISEEFDHFDANISLLLGKGCVCELDSGNNGDSR